MLITAGLSLKSSQGFLSELFVAIGGGALGTCFGITFGSVSDASILQRIREMLEFSLEKTLSAPEQNLDEYRKVWHHYLMTKINNKFVWRYRQFDFARLSVPGKIVATLAVPDSQGKTHTYNIEGFLIGTRLIFVQLPAGGYEPPVIHLYPQAGEYFRSIHVGLATLQSWDGDHLTIPVVMCKDPLVFPGHSGQYPREGTLPDSIAIELDKLWLREAKNAGLIPITGTGLQSSTPIPRSKP
ncbi:hypothetical protein [Oculatella sp. LEGE 06141]|uniref:hypothetical protein n=1 Tax=Oculatella sp. LEGE 06141 TaxID=1828648 RepID=UPI0018819706|nr:hypothetical protein [Oculatella sp. LEGE 06141]